jgi:FtsP/CotA-like multicopper oxidase with cupredoxin domain
MFRPNRRAVMAGLGAAALSSMLPKEAFSDEPQRTAWRAAEARFGWSDPAARSRGWSSKSTPVSSLATAEPLVRVKTGLLDIAFQNDLSASAALTWRGIDGAASAEPLLGRASLVAGGNETVRLALKHAGTMFCDLSLLGEGMAQPARGLPLIVNEAESVPVDRDEVILIEEWCVRSDGIAIAPGNDAKGTETVHTINGSFGDDVGILVRANTRLRLRLINAGQRSVVAFKIEDLDFRVMAIDSRPAEPFLARNGAVVLAPGSRVDAFVDVTGSAGTRFSMRLHDGRNARLVNQLTISDETPIRSAPLPSPSALPSNGLPAGLDLKNALRIDLPFGAEQKDWLRPAAFAATTPPAFRAKAGRTVVLSLTNRAQVTSVFHLHGHHFRLLDRLDDGWKPFWLDTIAIDAGQTQRIAFAAEYAGRWLIEAVETNWSAPKLLRWFSVA